MSNKSFFEEDGRDESKFTKKVKESPFMVVGLVGFVAAVGIGAYKYKYRGNMSTSVYLMQLRVISQSAVAGCLTIGLAYNMINQYILKKPKEE